MIETFVGFVLWLLVFVGVFAGFYVLSHLSVPQRDYSGDWRESL